MTVPQTPPWRRHLAIPDDNTEYDETDAEFAKRTGECPECGRTLHDANEVEQGCCYKCSDELD